MAFVATIDTRRRHRSGGILQSKQLKIVILDGISSTLYPAVLKL
jgi:hypothetical protein